MWAAPWPQLLCLGSSSSPPLISCPPNRKLTSLEWTPISPPSKPCPLLGAQLRAHLPLEPSSSAREIHPGLS